MKNLTRSAYFYFIQTIFFTQFTQALTLQIKDENGKPVVSAMVTESLSNSRRAGTTDNGYEQSGKTVIVDPDFTKFTDHNGEVKFDERATVSECNYKIRKPHFQDQQIKISSNQKNASIKLKTETDPIALAESKPANIWLGALNLGSAEDKIHFQMQCGFCHQQGSSFMRRERTAEDWEATIKRMVRYGSRLPSTLQKSLPLTLHNEFKRLRENPSALAEPVEWESALQNFKITQWPVGDSMSQTHDVLTAKSSLVYVADNIQDRIYEVNPKTNEITVYRIPHLDGEKNGGLIAGRLKEFPRHDSTSNAHSLAESQVDGHIFITPSAQRRIVEFDPKSKTFILHEINAGFYPHTIRIDQKDRVWFTLALSNQVGMLDRKTDKFTLYDLPTRSLKEKIVVKLMPVLFKIIGMGIPLSNMLGIDKFASGTPMPYGIDITPDGKIWFARLHTKEIGNVDPETGRITMVETPFFGPRRLRSDKQGNLWVASFGESLIAKYNPEYREFKTYNLPVLPKGSETPYSLMVDKVKDQVWVTGNQSNNVFIFDIKNETWQTIPLPKRVFFTRDFDVAEDGAIYTSNSNFPSWQIEDAQPTLIRFQRFK